VQRFWNAPAVAEKPGLKAVEMFRGVADGRIKALWVVATNSAHSWIGQRRARDALSRLDFLVVQDMYANTDTAQLAHLVLPAVTLGMIAAAIIARLTRSSMLEVLGQDYVRTARAKGLGSGSVIVRHALRNALIPVVTVFGLQFGNLLAGAVIVETVFSRPGLGRLIVGGILAKDFPLVQGTVLFVAAAYVLINVVVDVAYAYVDPRIRIG